MSETAAKYETGNLDRDELLSNGFQCIYHEQFEEAIRLFDRAIEMEPDLLTCQARALCETFLLTDPPNVSQVIKIISNLTEALRLAVEHFEITPDTWTAEKFKELISEQKYKETYYSKGQIERFSELGADLMNLVDKEQWGLSYRFRKLYFAFYFKGRPSSEFISMLFLRNFVFGYLKRLLSTGKMMGRQIAGMKDILIGATQVVLRLIQQM